MKRISLAVVAICCAFACALVGCSGGGAHKTDAESLKGFWVLEDESLGFTGMMSLEEEDFAEVLIGDTYLEGTWKADGSTATFTSGDEAESKSVNIYVEGDKLIYGSEAGSRLVFVKSNEDDFYAKLEEGDESIEVGSDGLTDMGEETDIVEEVIEDITPVTIADDASVKIEVTGKGTDFTADPGYRLIVTNKTDKTIFLGANGAFKVDGKDYEAGLGDMVDPNDTIETFLFFDSEEVGGGADKLKGVEGTIIVYDDEAEKELGSYTFKMD